MNVKQIVLISFSLFLATACQDEEMEIPNPEDVRLKSVQTIGHGWTLSTVYDYLPDGNLTTVQWERNTPFTTIGTEEYVYGADKRLEKQIISISGVVVTEMRYFYFQGKIVAASAYVEGIKDHYTFFEYNQAGQLIRTEHFKRDDEANGYFQDGEQVFSYHADGNLHKIELAVFSSEVGGLIWNNTKTYASYRSEPSVVDSESILPGLKLQKNLPTGYELETAGDKFKYSFAYRFYPNGLPADRVTTYPDGQTEQSVYTYQ